MSDPQLTTESRGTVSPPDPDRPLPEHDLQVGDVVYQASLYNDETDDNGRAFTVVEDRGRVLLCEAEDGTQYEMNPDKLTKGDG